MGITILIGCIIALILLITWGKLNPFIAFLIVSVLGGLALGIPVRKIPELIEKGIGDILGSLVIILMLGAMLGKLVAESGAAEQISKTLLRLFGKKNIVWALTMTGFVVGIPLFYNVGFVLFVPLVFTVAWQFKLPPVYLGIAMLSALSVTHGFLPPHPSPTVLVTQFGASLPSTLIYGLMIAIPTIIIAGPLFASTLRNIRPNPPELFRPRDVDDRLLPGKLNSFLTALLPVLLLVLSTILGFTSPDNSWTYFFSSPSIVMLIALLIATFTLGLQNGRKMSNVMKIYGGAIAEIAPILLIIAGAGAMKQVISESGIDTRIAQSLMDIDIHPLVLGWLMAAAIRVCLGSATIAGLTTAGIIAPLIVQTNSDPNLMVLAVGAGSLIASHVNDTGFWMYKQYFNTSLKQTFQSWTMMETLVGLLGLAGVMILNYILH